MNSFFREKFFPIKRNLSLNEIESLIKNILIKSKLNDNFEINDVSSLNNLIKNSILFLNDSLLNIEQYKEDICIITDSEDIFHSDFKNIFLVNDLSYSYNLILNEKEIKSDNLCSICHTTVSNVKTICNHYYCEDCLLRWLAIKQNCPMCRKQFYKL